MWGGGVVCIYPAQHQAVSPGEVSLPQIVSPTRPPSHFLGLQSCISDPLCWLRCPLFSRRLPCLGNWAMCAGELTLAVPSPMRPLLCRLPRPWGRHGLSRPNLSHLCALSTSQPVLGRLSPAQQESPPPRDFPGGPVAETSHSQCRGPRSHACSEN